MPSYLIYNLVIILYSYFFHGKSGYRLVACYCTFFFILGSPCFLLRFGHGALVNFCSFGRGNRRRGIIFYFNFWIFPSFFHLLRQFLLDHIFTCKETVFWYLGRNVLVEIEVHPRHFSFVIFHLFCIFFSQNGFWNSRRYRSMKDY